MVATVEDFISFEIAVSLLTVVCHNVAVEPEVQPLSGEWFQHKTSNINDGVHLDDGARLGVCAQGFWADKHQGAFFNIKVFKPYKPSSCKFTTESVYRRHDGEKRHSYERRILEVEYGTFTTSVLGSGLDGSTSNRHIQATSLPPGWETRTVMCWISPCWDYPSRAFVDLVPQPTVLAEWQPSVEAFSIWLQERAESESLAQAC